MTFHLLLLTEIKTEGLEEGDYIPAGRLTGDFVSWWYVHLDGVKEVRTAVPGELGSGEHHAAHGEGR